MRKLSKFSCSVLVCLLALSVSTAIGQNTILTTSTSIPSGGSGFANVLIGPNNTYSSFFSGSYNVAIGSTTLNINSTGSYNSFLGYQAGEFNTIGNENSYLGFKAGIDNTEGSRNTLVGANAGSKNRTGNDNSFIGSEAGYYNTTGHDNTFVGTDAGQSNTTASYNTFTGRSAGNGNSTGNYNSFMGYEAGKSNTSGNFNSFIGTYSGLSNTTGERNSFLGYTAGQNNTTGIRNTFLGSFSGLNNLTGNYNSFLGHSAGISNTGGHDNTYLGRNADGVGGNGAILQRSTALGYNAKVAVNDGLVLGDTASVKVGIGTAYPNQRLTLRGNMNFVAYENSLRLKNQPFLHFNEHESLALGLGSEIPSGAEGTLVLGSETTQVLVPSGAEGSSGLVLSQYAGQPNIGQVLTVNEYGKVVLTQPRIQVASVADWSDKVFEPGYALRPLGEVEDFVKKNKHLPGIPSANTMVAEGMESAAFNAKLLEKIEELTLYVVKLEKRLKDLEIK